MSKSESFSLSTSLQKNKEFLSRQLPLNASFDFITRDLMLGNTPCFFLALNGLSDLDVVLKIFSEIKLSDFHEAGKVPNKSLPEQIKSQFLYTQIEFSFSGERLINALLSGVCVLLIEGYGQGLIIDTRDYPDRSVEEPDAEKVIRGAKDGFVESLVTNCCLIRRRLRSPNLTFSLQNIGTLSRTDVVLAYLGGSCDPELLKEAEEKLSSLSASALTMGVQSLKELLVKKSFFHPMPDFFLTSRPDVACSYLTEGYILALVDNSPFALYPFPVYSESRRLLQESTGWYLVKAGSVYLPVNQPFADAPVFTSFPESRLASSPPSGIYSRGQLSPGTVYLRAFCRTGSGFV